MAGDRQLRCEAAFGLADDILRAIRAATSWPALRTVARDVTDAMGFRYFALITHEDLREPRSGAVDLRDYAEGRSEEHTSELQSLMRISYAVFCLKKKKK